MIIFLGGVCDPKYFFKFWRYENFVRDSNFLLRISNDFSTFWSTLSQHLLTNSTLKIKNSVKNRKKWIFYASSKKFLHPTSNFLITKKFLMKSLKFVKHFCNLQCIAMMRCWRCTIELILQFFGNQRFYHKSCSKLWGVEKVEFLDFFKTWKLPS